MIGRRSEISHALVLFNVESGSENQVLEEVKKVAGVEEAYVSYGSYDIAAKINAQSMDGLKVIISNKLRQISKVRSTLTLLLIE